MAFFGVCRRNGGTVLSRYQCCTCGLRRRVDKKVGPKFRMNVQYTVQVTCYKRFRSPRFRISAVLFQYHEEHQYPIHDHGRSCRAGQLRSARSFTDSSHHFDSGYCRLRPPMVYHSENSRALKLFSFYVFSIYTAICRNATPAYN
jgi:hypothetical protein